MGQDLCVGSPGGPGDIWYHQQHGCAGGMSLQANGTRMAALRLLSLPQLQAIPSSPRLIPGFWRQWKIQIPFFGKTESKGSCGEALEGMWIFRDADVRLDKEL